MGHRAITVLVVDDHAVVRAGIRALLAEVEDIQLVGEARDGEEAVGLAEALCPDVILMDLVMPRVDGITAIRRIIEDQPDARILALTSFSADDKVFPALKAGAVGYLLKDAEPVELIRSIRQIKRGESSLHPNIARKVLSEFHRHPGSNPAPEHLTEREAQVLELVAKGCTNQEIADQLFLSEGTVRTHVSHILGKLQIANRVQATLYALRSGLSTLD